MKIRVVYVINGTTENDILEAPFISSTILTDKRAEVDLYDDNLNQIGFMSYGECYKIESVEEKKT